MNADVLIWVQHLLGTGHLKRAATLAAAMSERGLRVVVASGGSPAPWLIPPGTDLVQLPPIHADAQFRLLDAGGAPPGDALWAERRRRLLALLDARRPRVLITEMFPFGRRAFRTEVTALLDAAHRAWRLASVRDILVAKGPPEAYAWMRDLALDRYDRVLVHADPTLVPFELTFPFAADLGARLVYTGYVTEAGPPHGASTDGRGEVLVSAGGARVGQRLLALAREAQALSRHGAVPWRLTGALPPGTPARAEGGLILDRPRADFRRLLANSLLSVSQAGYNTVVEALRLRKPCVLVPFETASETEQRVRAQRLAALGLARVVWEKDLSAQALARAVDASLEAPRAPRVTLDLEGAGVTAGLVIELLGRGSPGG